MSVLIHIRGWELGGGGGGGGFCDECLNQGGCLTSSCGHVEGAAAVSGNYVWWLLILFGVVLYKHYN